MRADLSGLLGAVGASVTAPAPTARRLMALDLPLPFVLQGLVAVSSLGALVRFALAGGTMPVGSDVAPVGPVALAVALALGLALMAAALGVAGRMLGGTGRFRDVLAVIVWIEVVALAVSLAQAVTLLALPVAAPLIGIAGIAVMLWCLVQFLQVAHGFPGPGRAALSLLLGALGVGLAGAVILTALGGLPDV